jgi:UDP-N-acetylmuramate dehydrogenase
MQKAGSTFPQHVQAPPSKTAPAPDGNLVIPHDTSRPGPAMQSVANPKLRSVLERLRTSVSGKVEESADLRCLSRWRIGGRASGLVEPATATETRLVLAALAEANLPVLVVGDGSNLLFDDAGFDGVIVRIGPALSGFRLEGQCVWAEAGVWVPRFVRELGRHGLSGLEHAIGIPGTLGGLIYMNGGSQRKGIGTNIVSVRGCDLRGIPFERSQARCAFHYRGSSLQTDRLIVLEANLSFTKADPRAIRREMIAILSDRRRKFPKNLPNCGSVFLSNPDMYSIVGPPGAAIERAGLKGTRLGGAEISSLHANFIVNLGQAASSDVLGLVHLARTRVHDETGFWMDCEVRHVAPNGSIRPAHEAAAEAVGAHVIGLET